MKRLSLKMKLTILYTVLMTTVVCGVLGILLSVNNHEILSSVQSQLEKKVAETREDIRYRDGALEFDSDILELEYGIYLSVYASDGTMLYGKIPYDFDNSVPFTDGEIQKIKGNQDVQFYVMDMVYQIPDYGVVDIRGVTSITEAESSFVMTVRLAMIFLPLLVCLMGMLAYYMTSRTLRPVEQIAATAQSIQKDGDLSRRIALGDGKDEIYCLASTIDQLLEEIEKSFKREQQFTSDVAHELRTPITTMRLQCEELLENKTVNDETKKEIQILDRRVKHLSTLVSQLLVLSRIDQGRAVVEKENINFSELTEMAIEEIRVVAEQKHISVHSEIQPEIFIQGDETLLIRMWMNLLKNAVNYGKERGTIKVFLQKDGKKINGSVKDDGIGISEKDLPHIWKRFYRADKSRTEAENSGLGLSIVEWIVKEHGGEIWAESRLGEGSIFYFSFPVI